MPTSSHAYILAWDEQTKKFIIREVRGAGSYEFSDNFTTIDDSGFGLLDAMAEMNRYAKESGWKNWILEVQS